MKYNMLKKNINTDFHISIAGENRWYPMEVPGSVMDTYAREGVLPDPYFGTNEYLWTEFFRNDFEVKGSFAVSEEEYEKEEILLTFFGIDTIADIFLNGEKLAHTENMHRTYSYSAKNLVKPGENLLTIYLYSPIRYVESIQPEKGREITFINTGSLPGGQYIRKAHCMYGWDWGPQLPDLGIFREIQLCCYDTARLGESLIRQEHVPDQNGKTKKVVLHIKTEIDAVSAECGTAGKFGDAKNTEIFYELTAPDGALLYQGTSPDIEIQNPQLWWPNGLGRHPLYSLKVSLLTDEAGLSDQPQNRAMHLLDQKIYRIGLRTLTVSQEEDQWGNEFAIQVNGVKIFARGANYIPDDAYVTHITRETLERDIEAALFANFNCLRVWGGGFYPSDTFYDLCDENGLLVWQDLMYACNIYDLNPSFEENICAETRDNLLRFRNHASLALICGNNELESAWNGWAGVKDHAPSLKRDYLLQFEYILPKLVKELAPDTFYWPSSPSSGGSFDDPDSENRGDCHYWDVWHGQKPFSEYMNHYFRFCSEFGFQSLPSIRTVESFTEEKDRNLFSRVMESHQKNPAANGKILYYISENFRYPKDLESLIFISQILQGYAMKEATEHWRRNRGRCMGSIYWQFNDNWPVASWSSMDYYGRYKALHYMAKTFCDTIAGSIEKKDAKMGFWISNETLEPVTVKAKVSLKTLDFDVLDETEVSMEIPALSARCMSEKDYGQFIKGKEDQVFLAAEYEYNQKIPTGKEYTDSNSSSKIVKKKEFETFVPMKYLELKDPQFEIRRQADGSVSVSAKTFVPYCMLEGISKDIIWQDNVVCITDKEPVTFQNMTPNQEGEIRIYDVYHTY